MTNFEKHLQPELCLCLKIYIKSIKTKISIMKTELELRQKKHFFFKHKNETMLKKKYQVNLLPHKLANKFMQALQNKMI